MIAPRCAALALLFVAHSAYADDPLRPEDQLAQSLFDEAITLMNDARYDEACPKLAESQRLAPGGGTLLNLAYCLERQGKYASAYTAYNEALSAAIKDGRKEREAAAREHLAIVLPLLSRVVLRVPRENRAPELDVRFDGTPVREAAWGVAAPVNPGPHEIVATASGKIPWKLVIQVEGTGTTQEVIVGPLTDAPPPPIETKKPVIVQAPAERKTMRTGAFIAIGVSAAFLLEGIIAGSIAIAKHQEKVSKLPTCGTDNACINAAFDAEDVALGAAWAANIGFIGMLASGLAAGVLWFASATPKSTMIVPTTNGAILRGTF